MNINNCDINYQLRNVILHKNILYNIKDITKKFYKLNKSDKKHIMYGGNKSLSKDKYNNDISKLKKKINDFEIVSLNYYRRNILVTKQNIELKNPCSIF